MLQIQTENVWHLVTSQHKCINKCDHHFNFIEYLKAWVRFQIKLTSMWKRLGSFQIIQFRRTQGTGWVAEVRCRGPTTSPSGLGLEHETVLWLKRPLLWAVNPFWIRSISRPAEPHNTHQEASASSDRLLVRFIVLNFVKDVKKLVQNLYPTLIS